VVTVKECFKKKQKELLSSSVTLYITSFGITMGPNSYIGSDRMLRTVADLWELHRSKIDKAKVVMYIGPWNIIMCRYYTRL